MKIDSRMLLAIVAALALAACPPPDADQQEEVAESAEATEGTERTAADAVDPAADVGWRAEFAGAHQGTFQGATAVPEEAAGQLTLRLSSDARGEEPPVTMMVALPALDSGQTGELPAENATVMVGATSYFHVPDQPTTFTVRIEEHEDDRLAGTFAGTLRPDGPGDPLEVQGSFEAVNDAQRPPADAAPEGTREGDAEPST